MGRKRRREQYEEEEDEWPPEGVYHYCSRGDLPWDIQNYFSQRYELFSKYDDGIWMTEDTWFGVTPERVAEKIAYHVGKAYPPQKCVLIDAFAGAGGNTIAFARSGRWKRIYAVEKDPRVLACCKHNAEIYGVGHLISWYEGDCFKIIGNELAELGEYAAIFGSPPWGGPGYKTDQVFDLSRMLPYSFSELYSTFHQFSDAIALYLPRSSDIRQISARARSEKKIAAIQYCLKGGTKALCAFFGAEQEFLDLLVRGMTHF